VIFAAILSRPIKNLLAHSYIINFLPFVFEKELLLMIYKSMLPVQLVHYLSKGQGDENNGLFDIHSC